MGYFDDLTEPPPTQAPKTAPGRASSDAGSRPFDLANALPTADVCDFLAIEHDGTHATCPGCSEPGAAIALDRPGFKCSHDRCSSKGKNGWRSNVDLVAEVQGGTAIEAVNALAARFGFDGFGAHAPTQPRRPTPRGAPEPTARPAPGPQTGTAADDTPEAHAADEERADDPPGGVPKSGAPSNEGTTAKVDNDGAAVRLVTLGSLLDPALEQSEQRRSGGEVPVPILFEEYARIMGGGLWAGAHFTVAGTGVGKSQLEIQDALATAQAGIPSIYVGLELDAAQIACRALGIEAGIGWSGLYLGRCSAEVIARARDAASAIRDVPFYVDFGPPRGWPASRLYALVEAVRKRHPGGPLRVVLDYLQLVGEEDSGGYSRRPDLRERIGSAAYVARDVARRFGASVKVVSSAARTYYGLLASDVKEAGLATIRQGHSGPVKAIRNPNVLIGLGKESGELEYAGDSVTVLVKWPAPLDNGETVILCVVPKLRWGPPGWCAFSFDGRRFAPLPIDGTEDLPEVAAGTGGRGRPPVADAELERRVVATLRKLSQQPGRNGRPVTRREVVSATDGTDAHLYAAIKRAMVAGSVVVGQGHSIRAADIPAAEEAAEP